jgi:hypothetical protein
MLIFGGGGGLVGPKTWYKKKIHRPIAARPRTRIGLAIAMLKCCCVLSTKIMHRR